MPCFILAGRLIPRDHNEGTHPSFVFVQSLLECVLKRLLCTPCASYCCAASDIRARRVEAEHINPR